MIRVRQATQLIAALLMLFALGSGEVAANILTKTPDWAGKKRTLCVCFVPGTSESFKAAAKAAGGKWNAASTGWTFNFDCDPPCDVTIREGESGGGPDFPKLNPGDSGVARHMGNSSGTTSVLITIHSGLDATRLEKVLLHELGHAMRLAHGSDGTVMADTAPEVSSTVTDEDKKEAEASNKDPACPMLASSYLLRGEASQNLNFTPAPGSGISLANVTSVSVVSLMGSDVTYTVDHWTSSAIYVVASVSSSAPNNEVQRTTLTYANQTVATYTGLIWIADDPIGMNVLPHAVAGTNQTVTLGDDVTLDGSDSYHDDSSLTSKMSALWEVDDSFITSKAVVLTLGLGTHTATLWVQDTYGRVASDSITITVVH